MTLSGRSLADDCSVSISPCSGHMLAYVCSWPSYCLLRCTVGRPCARRRRYALLWVFHRIWWHTRENH